MDLLYIIPAMRSRSSIGNYIVLIRDLVSDVEDILDDGI